MKLQLALDDMPLVEAILFAKKVEEYIDIIEKDMNFVDLQELVGKPVRTVPQIFIGEQHIGGYTDFYDHVVKEGL